MSVEHLHETARALPPDSTSAAAESDDAALVRAAQRDSEAFGLIYELYADRVFSYMRSRFASVGASDNLTQQTFTRALQALPKYRPGAAPFGAWLFRIARSVAVDAARKKRLATVPLEFVPEVALPQEPLDTHLGAGRTAFRTSRGSCGRSRARSRTVGPTFRRGP